MLDLFVLVFESDKDVFFKSLCFIAGFHKMTYLVIPYGANTHDLI